MNKKKALIVDGNSMLYRAYYATEQQLKYCEEHDLFPTNALKLMIDQTIKLRNLKEYDYLVMAFDAGKITFRTEMFDGYKSNRAKMPEQLALQVPIVQQSVELIGYNVIKIPNIEADDIVGSVAKTLSQNQDTEVDIYSSDKDLLQLVDNNITVHLIKKGLVEVDDYNIDNFKNKLFGLSPNQVPDYKAIVGDKSDNIPGAKGVGEKTGIKLLEDYKTLENIYNNIEQLTNKTKQVFIESKDNLFLFKDIATIKTDLYKQEDLSNFLTNDINKKELSKIIKQFNLKSLEKYI